MSQKTEMNPLHLTTSGVLNDKNIYQEYQEYINLKKSFFEEENRYQKTKENKKYLKKVFKWINFIKELDSKQDSFNNVEEGQKKEALRENLKTIIFDGISENLNQEGKEKNYIDVVNKYELMGYLKFDALAEQIFKQLQEKSKEGEDSLPKDTIKNYTTNFKKQLEGILSYMKNKKEISSESKEGIISFIDHLLLEYEQGTKDLKSSTDSLLRFLKNQNIKVSSKNSKIYGQIGEHIVAMALSLAEGLGKEEIEKVLSIETLKESGIITGGQIQQQKYISEEFDDGIIIQAETTKGGIQIKTDVKNTSKKLNLSVKNYDFQLSDTITMQQEVTISKILSMENAKKYRYSYLNFLIEHKGDNKIKEYKEIKKGAFQVLLYCIVARAIAGGGTKEQSNLLVIMNSTGKEVYITDIYDILEKEEKNFSNFLSADDIGTGLEKGTLSFVEADPENYQNVFNILMQGINRKFDVFLPINELKNLPNAIR